MSKKPLGPPVHPIELEGGLEYKSFTIITEWFYGEEYCKLVWLDRPGFPVAELVRTGLVGWKAYWFGPRATSIGLFLGEKVTRSEAEQLADRALGSLVHSL